MPTLEEPYAGCHMPGRPATMARLFRQGSQKHRPVRLEIVTPAWTGVCGVWAPDGAVIDGNMVLPTGVPVLTRWGGHADEP